MSLRAMPELAVFRPADANETVAGWRYAMTRGDGPTALVLSRQDLPVVTAAGAPGAERGAYVLADAEGGAADAIVIATGSEVALAVEARQHLAGEGVRVRVVSMPCWELFAEQEPAYREAVLPAAITARVAVEAGSTFGWCQHVGSRGAVIGIDRFGASAPGELLLEKLGITTEAVIAAVRRVLGR